MATKMDLGIPFNKLVLKCKTWPFFIVALSPFFFGGKFVITFSRYGLNVIVLKKKNVSWIDERMIFSLLLLLVFHCCVFPLFSLAVNSNLIFFSAKKLDDSMDTAEPLSKKRRVSWIDERMRKPLHEVKYIAKENIGKKAAEAKGQKISKEILLASNSTKNRMRKFVYSCPPRKLQMNYYV